MKKMMSFVLALILVMSLGIVAFAADVTGGIGAYSTDVKGSYVPGTTSGGTLFSVDIKWENMSFTYHAAQAGAWDSENHEYEDDTPAYWVGTGKITVTNHSNAKITATPAYTAADGYGDATMTFAPASLNLDSAEGGSAQIGTITVTPGGSLPQMDQEKTIGSITVTIAQKADVTAAELETLLAQAQALYNDNKNNSQLKDALGETWNEFTRYCSVVSSTLEYYEQGEVTQEGLNEAYETLRTYYNAVLAAKS